MSISIFAKNPSRARGGQRLQRVSSIIRGQQIAQYLGAKLNPQDGYETDVCIYVKPHVKPDEDFTFSGHPYLDIIDGWVLLHLAKRHPEVPIITCSYVDFEYVSALVDNKVILIPQHHCNFEQIKRTREEITTIGCIGADAAFDYIPLELKEEIKKRGMELVEYSSFKTREDICSFYQEIDIQLVWRPYIRKQKIRLSNPLKLVNAASFGVPTIALDEPTFVEFKDNYLPVKSVDEFLDRLDALRASPQIYKEYSEKCLSKADNYHIEQISKLYKALR